jgi:hypothetical protein
MGCCNNHYRKAVEAEECRINEKGKDQIIKNPHEIRYPDYFVGLLIIRRPFLGKIFIFSLGKFY